jgi:hypothetical protein
LTHAARRDPLTAVNRELFSIGSTSTCGRQPEPGPNNPLYDWLTSGVFYPTTVKH